MGQSGARAMLPRTSSLRPGNCTMLGARARQVRVGNLGLRKTKGDTTHPCLVPYDDLTPNQKVKDAVFLAVVSTCLKINNQEAAETADGT